MMHFLETVIHNNESLWYIDLRVTCTLLDTCFDEYAFLCYDFFEDLRYSA